MTETRGRRSWGGLMWRSSNPGQSSRSCRCASTASRAALYRRVVVRIRDRVNVQRPDEVGPPGRGAVGCRSDRVEEGRGRPQRRRTVGGVQPVALDAHVGLHQRRRERQAGAPAKRAGEAEEPPPRPLDQPLPAAAVRRTAEGVQGAKMLPQRGAGIELRDRSPQPIDAEAERAGAVEVDGHRRDDEQPSRRNTPAVRGRARPRWRSMRRTSSRRCTYGPSGSVGAARRPPPRPGASTSATARGCPRRGG